MIYEYECTKGHVIEATVKLNGEGTPASCTAVTGSIHSLVLTLGTYVSDKVVCGAPLRRILSLTSGYFPGAGSWRGA